MGVPGQCQRYPRVCYIASRYPARVTYAKRGSQNRFYAAAKIDHEHRLVYKVDGHALYIAQCRYHY